MQFHGMIYRSTMLGIEYNYLMWETAVTKLNRKEALTDKALKAKSLTKSQEKRIKAQTKDTKKIKKEVIKKKSILDRIKGIFL